MARPSRINATIIQDIADGIRIGLTFRRACEAAQLPESTAFRWKARGAEETEGIYREFWEAITRADPERERALVGHIRAAGAPHPVEVTKTQVREILVDGQVQTLTTTTTEVRIESDWRASLSLLKVLYPDRYSERVRAELTGAGGEPLLPVDAIAEVARLVRSEVERSAAGAPDEETDS